MTPPSSSDPLRRVFGTLELRVLDALWARGAACTVRDIESGFSGVAYTTLMTTLDRLHRKGVLAREKAGRAFSYHPKLSREALLSSVAGDALTAMLGPRGAELKPVVSFLVEAVRREDREALDALEALVREHGSAEDER